MQQTEAERPHISIRLGLMNGREQNNAINEEGAALYVYLDQNLLDMVSLTDNTHAIRLPLGS